VSDIRLTRLAGILKRMSDTPDGGQFSKA